MTRSRRRTKSKVAPSIDQLHRSPARDKLGLRWAPITGRPEEICASSSDATNDGFGFPKVAKSRSRPKRPHPRRALIAAALDAAADEATRRRLTDETSIAVVVQVPTAAWVAPVADHLKGMARWDVFERDGSNRTHHRPTTGNDEVSGVLARGGRVLGVSQNPEMLLPAALTAAADVVVRIANPTGAVLRETLRRAFAGYVPVRIDDALMAGLDLETIVATMRAGSKPSEVLERLRAASSKATGGDAGGRLPDLGTAVEYGEARDWGLALADDFADYRAGRISWSEVDRGAVLHSPPGCGKSLFARLLASACGVPLIATSVAELFSANDGHLGDVVKALRSTFARASEAAPCILFLDEIDAVPDRRSLSDRNRDFWLPVVNDFLLLLDAAVAGQRAGVVVIGATNMIDRVDPALLRPGRLERAIHINLPDAAGAANILKHHLGPEGAKIDHERFGRMLAGTTGADIMAHVRAARRLARRAQRPLTEADLFETILPAGTLTPDNAHRTAVHEAGHAIVSFATGTLQVRDVVVGGANRAGRAAVRMNDKLPTRRSIEDYVVGLLGGRAAEKACIGSISAGAGGDARSDLGLATVLVASLHTAYGLMKDLTFRANEASAIDTLASDPALRRVVERDLRRLQRRADDLARRHCDAILALAEMLLRDRHVSGERARSIFDRIPPSPPVGRRRTKTIH